ncbi:outer membrane transport energization protein ExbD (TC 2.C.1.1.1) [Thalassobaculum litoreum DSM 18839]|uniref:Outer membrane transport energization protein ExbD (TC 2.C.1.1.1) n=1 Tax=Thalassobaculum litoreum DSM 18839 TaxID=1123362 RepID=A0A8G2F4I2_9PROT|nr:outer membrane transport energization protein ExbD (TC 2.C.1.1.1) [Thalassobaculum litoreum DSM 18839]
MDEGLPDYAPPRLANSGRRRRSVISLTPLIDVVFILLVFFMLASSFLDWRTIDLAAPASAGAGASMTGAMLLEVRQDGLRLSGHMVSLDEAESRIMAKVREKPDQRVLIKPADGVVLQDTVRVLDRLSAAGVANMSFVRTGSR